MRKISKLSLVAAVAVSGLSFANAQPLEEAIKNVEVSGSVVYRYDNFDGDKARDARTDLNRYKIGLNLSSKVNDYVKFNSRFIVGGDNNSYAWADTNAKKGGGDGKAEVSLSQAYFGLSVIPNTIINIGKQGLPTPYTKAVDINGNEQAGTGILALTNFSVVTLGAGYFNNSNIGSGTNDIYATPGNNGLTGVVNGVLDSGADLYVATAQADLDFVKLEAWYLGMQDTFNSYTLAATSKLDLAENAKLGLEARYVQLALENDIKRAAGLTSDDNAMFRLAVDGKFSIVNARIAYTKTDKDGGLTAVDQDAQNTSLGWAITTNGLADAQYWQASLGIDILDNLNFTAHYGNLEADASNKNTLNGVVTRGAIGASDKIEQEEVFGQLTYKMSKNLTTYLRYGTFEQKIGSTKVNDSNRGRIQVAYTF